MATEFDLTLDQACDRKHSEVGRVLFLDEIQELKDRQFIEWIKAKRFDELIEYVLDEFEIEGGFGYCSSISEALRKHDDLPRIERLFEGLLGARKKAFWAIWPKAQQAHVGAMREAARHAASVMEAFSGLWHGYWSLKHEAGMQNTQDAMLRFQAREQQ